MNTDFHMNIKLRLESDDQAVAKWALHIAHVHRNSEWHDRIGRRKGVVYVKQPFTAPIGLTWSAYAYRTKGGMIVVQVPA